MIFQDEHVNPVILSKAGFHKKKGTDFMGPVPVLPLLCNPLDLGNHLFRDVLRRLIVALEVHG
jgi:hypothetical protein